MADVDLRKEFNEIIENHGHYVLLHRTSRKLRCICYDEKTKESSIELYIKNTGDVRTKHKECPRCGGTAWFSRIERLKTRRDAASDMVSLSNRLQDTPLGAISFDNMTFFFNHDVAPKSGDYIYEVGWDGNRPTHLVRGYQINAAIDYREHQGRIEFWQAVAKEDTVDTGIKGFTVKRLGPINNYEILR